MLAKNSKFINHEIVQFGFILIGQESSVEVSFTDCVLENSRSTSLPMANLNTLKTVNFETIVLEDIVGTMQPILQLENIVESVSIKNLIVNNVSGTTAGVSDIIVCANFPQTVTLIEQVYMFNLSLDGIAAIRSNSELDQIQIIDCVFESINMGSSDYLINTGQIKSVILSNITFSNIKTTDDKNTDGVVLFINTFDLNSELDTSIQDIIIDDCEIPFIVLSSVINETPANKTFSLSNISFTNTHFENDRILISTNNIQLNTSLQIIMSNLVFSNISFSRTGTLIECKQQLPTYLTITGSSFTDLNAAVIRIESSSTQNDNLTALVQINDTVFDNIDDQYNSLINVNEGGQLEINN